MAHRQHVGPQRRLFRRLRRAGFEWKQLAQDGVQFADDNYQKSANKPFLMASGNRVDLLVKAPMTTGKYNRHGAARGRPVRSRLGEAGHAGPGERHRRPREGAADGVHRQGQVSAAAAVPHEHPDGGSDRRAGSERSAHRHRRQPAAHHLRVDATGLRRSPGAWPDLRDAHHQRPEIRREQSERRRAAHARTRSRNGRSSMRPSARRTARRSRIRSTSTSTRSRSWRCSIRTRR